MTVRSASCFDHFISKHVWKYGEYNHRLEQLLYPMMLDRLKQGLL